MNSIDLFLLQSDINLLGELVKSLSCFDTWTKSIQSDYVSLSNAVLKRERLYELVTSSNNDQAVVQDLKRKVLQTGIVEFLVWVFTFLQHY